MKTRSIANRLAIGVALVLVAAPPTQAQHSDYFSCETYILKECENASGDPYVDCVVFGVDNCLTTYPEDDSDGARRSFGRGADTFVLGSGEGVDRRAIGRRFELNQ